MGETWTSSHDRPAPHGLWLSVLLHSAFLAALLSMVPEGLLDAPEDHKIDVEIITLTAPRKREATPTQVLSDVQPAEPAKKNPKDAMIRPGKMLSASLLAHPDNADGRRDFSHLSSDEKREQLCALEALEQIRAWNPKYHPLRMVSYTFSEVQYDANHIIADGAAFWSHDNWHRLKFDCELSEDQKEVINFAFLVGVIVPKDQWEDHNLTKYK